MPSLQRYPGSHVYNVKVCVRICVVKNVFKNKTKNKNNILHERKEISNYDGITADCPGSNHPIYKTFFSLYRIKITQKLFNSYDKKKDHVNFTSSIAIILKKK